MVPKKLTFGPAFILLANRLSLGPLTFGLNRQSGNLLNAGIAARDLVNHVSNLYAIELGNEPECKHFLSFPLKYLPHKNEEFL
jgi:hypothetical protein